MCDKSSCLALTGDQCFREELDEAHGDPQPSIQKAAGLSMLAELAMSCGAPARVAYWTAWSALGPGERGEASAAAPSRSAALRALRGRPVLLLVGPKAHGEGTGQRAAFSPGCLRQWRLDVPGASWKWQAAGELYALRPVFKDCRVVPFVLCHDDWQAQQSGNLKKSNGARGVLDLVAMHLAFDASLFCGAVNDGKAKRDPRRSPCGSDRWLDRYGAGGSPWNMKVATSMPIVNCGIWKLFEKPKEWETKHRGMGQICKTDREKDFPYEACS